MNLCSFKWLNPILNLVIHFTPIRLWILNTEFEGGLIPLIKFFLKAELDKFWILESNSFYSTMVPWKKDDLKLSVLHWYVGILAKLFFTDLVKWWEEVSGNALHKQDRRPIIFTLWKVHKWLRSQNTFFSWHQYIYIYIYIYLHKAKEKPYLNLYFKFHDFFPSNNKNMKILSFWVFSFSLIKVWLILKTLIK